jgi:hypothetical protein
VVIPVERSTQNPAHASHDHATGSPEVSTDRACHFVGWLGSIVAFLALAITGLTSQDVQLVRSVHLAMHLTTWYVILPFSFALLLTGLVSSLGTQWGLFRHYWVVFKLLINVFANIVLVMYVPTLDYLAEVAAGPTLSTADLQILRDPSAVLHSSLALLLLLVATVLGLYKSRGLTPYGRRKHREQRTVSQPVALATAGGSQSEKQN